MSAVLDAPKPSAPYLEAVQPGLVRQFELLTTAPGGVARLRELLLVLAVQGRLVPQNPIDGTGQESLKRIQAERDRLISTGVVKEPKRIKGVGGDELPFEIPPSWGWAPLADLVRVLNGRAYAKQELLDAGPTPVLRVGNLFTSDHWYYSDLSLDHDKRCNPGDLLFAWSASFGPFIWDGPEAFFHYHIWKLDPIAPKLFNTRYFHLFLREKTAELKAAGHGVSMVHLTKEKMERIPVPWPPLGEQARIVARVDELMLLCDALEAQGRLEAQQHARLLDTLLCRLTDSSTPEELAANWQRVAGHFELLLDRPEAVDALEQTILQLAVRGLLVRQDPNDKPASTLVDAIREEKSRWNMQRRGKREASAPRIDRLHIPFPAPLGWEWVGPDQITLQITDGTHHTPRYQPSGVAFISVKDIDGSTVKFGDCKYIAEDEHKVINARCNPERGDMLLCRIGTLGRPTLVDTDRPFSLFVSVGLMKLPKSQDIGRYLHLVLSSQLLADQYQSIKAGGSHTDKLNLGDIPRLQIPLPPLAEQNLIVARVTRLRRLCADLRQRLTASNATQAHLAGALIEEVMCVTPEAVRAAATQVVDGADHIGEDLLSRRQDMRPSG